MFFYSFGSLVFYYYTKKDFKYIFYFDDILFNTPLIISGITY